MTSEILLMNKEAIAMAADSAATLTDTKIFSANKIFTLSKYAPVGVMIYGNSQFMGIPWETIIKEYRKKLSTKKFASLHEYSNDFIDFLISNKEMLTKEEEKAFFAIYLNGYYQLIFLQIEAEVKKIIDVNKGISDAEIMEIVLKIISNHTGVWEKATFHPKKDSNSIGKFIKTHQSEIESLFDQKFEKIAQSLKSDIKFKEAYTHIFQISACYFLKQSKEIFFPDNVISGIVIAGFGEKEIFPSNVSLSIWIKLEDFVKYVENDVTRITLQTSANIHAFAQDEMVKLFMEGIDPTYQGIIYDTIDELFKKFPEFVGENISNLSDDEKKELVSKLQGKNAIMFTEFTKKLADYRFTKHIQPILDVVTNLPRDELAGMAESLVNLTSFKRRVSMQTETVGGPIDVAVITKGDGFIWIKRKHYFDSELNPHFFANYYHLENGNFSGGRK